MNTVITLPTWFVIDPYGCIIYSGTFEYVNGKYNITNSDEFEKYILSRNFSKYRLCLTGTDPTITLERDNILILCFKSILDMYSLKLPDTVYCNNKAYFIEDRREVRLRNSVAKKYNRFKL